ncbi:hypothetical protein GIB67_031651 [Kingdonia uniflora]|uniref:Uncharacterized protein n=1 Tax=Kingdonia uniflora TaxID=39325 RepID=A0A7J7NKB6_9MAGN|nr:hypothetical protein GIB67_031651 [Kingdonia uniflora]
MEGFVKDINCRGATDTNTHEDILAGRLQELALSLSLKYLSFDFVGTSLDKSYEEFGTIQLCFDFPTVYIMFSAGIGMLSMVKHAVLRMTGDNKVTGNNPFWLLNKDGLVTKARNNIEAFARGFGPKEIEGFGEGAVSLKCLASYMANEEINKGILFPSISSIRHITMQVGAAIVREGVVKELAEGHGDIGTKELMHMPEKKRRNM